MGNTTKTTKAPKRAARSELNKWAVSLPERRAIAEFMGWLQTGPNLDLTVNELDVERLLDKYHHINKAKLEKERRALLERARKESEKHESSRDRESVS